MSQLQDLCNTLTVIDQEILAMARELLQRGQNLNRAAQYAGTAVRNDDGSTNPAAMQAANALAVAARMTLQAAQLLQMSAHHGQSFVARTATGGGGTSGSSGFGSAQGQTETQTQSAAGPVADPGLPDPPEGVSYAATDGRSLFGLGVLNFDSAQQGALSDCFFVAGLCAVAGVQPALITDALVRANDGSVVCNSVAVTTTLPALGGADAYGRSPDGSTWVGLFEKAYASSIGGYNELNKGGWPSDAFEWITGQPATTHETARLDDDQLRAVLASGQPMVACNAGKIEEGDAVFDLADRLDVVLEGAHAYAVRGLDENGKVVLHNPWGESHPSPMTVSEFREVFWRLDVA